MVVVVAWPGLLICMLLHALGGLSMRIYAHSHVLRQWLTCGGGCRHGS